MMHVDILHDLRAPLHSIQGFVQLILDGKVPDPETQRQFLTIVARESQNLDKLIEGLIKSSASGPAPKVTRRNGVSMKKVILNATKQLGGLAAEKEVTIDADVDGPCPSVIGDEKALCRVVVNLLHNAIKFSPPRGKVIVTAVKNGNQLLTQVTDHGPGISKEVLAQLFDRPHPSPTVPARYRPGLGLHICKQIVEAHGGQIWAESEPGKYTTFNFTIPYALKPSGKRRSSVKG